MLVGMITMKLQCGYEKGKFNWFAKKRGTTVDQYVIVLP